MKSILRPISAVSERILLQFFFCSSDIVLLVAATDHPNQLDVAIKLAMECKNAWRTNFANSSVFREIIDIIISRNFNFIKVFFIDERFHVKIEKLVFLKILES